MLTSRLLAGSVVILCTSAVVASPPSTAVVDHRPVSVSGSAPADEPRSFAPRRVLVAPAAHTPPRELRAVHERLGSSTLGMLPGTRVREVRLPASLSVEEAVRRYERSGAVRFAEPDYLLAPSRLRPVTPDDTHFELLYGLHNTGQDAGTPDADIDATEAWSVTTGTSGPVVAVIDTGVDVNHPDLVDNVWTNPGEVAGNGLDDDANGYVDDVHGWDFYNQDGTVVDGADGDTHGTHVAGTIAATGDNGTGVVGVSWRARIMPLKFLGPDGGLTSDAIAALDYAVAHGAHISNNSWGGAGNSIALREAIEGAGAAGHLFVAAAGNGGRDEIGDDNDVAPEYPASYPSSNIVSVAATNRRDRLAGFSNFGAVSVDLGAPGVWIASTWPGGAYAYLDGTSMAAPHVSGAAALLLSHRPGLDAVGLKSRLLRTTDRKASLDSTVSGGRLNVARALGYKAPSRVTLTNTPRAGAYRAAVTLSGRLTAHGQGLGGRSVVLQQRPVGTTGWSRVTRGVRTTGPDGRFRLRRVRPREHTDYRARFAGDVDTARSSSAVVRNHVRARVSLGVLASTLALGRSREVAGAVRPAHDGTVRLVVKRNAVVVARTTVVLDGSRFRYSYRPPRPGRYTFVARRFADHDHWAGRSRARGFRVAR